LRMVFAAPPVERCDGLPQRDSGADDALVLDVLADHEGALGLQTRRLSPAGGAAVGDWGGGGGEGGYVRVLGWAGGY
jgi:hypothetical protein